jgi:SAM-dependent methyltransferase
VSGFDAGWLALREPADRRARDPQLRAEAARLATLRGGAIVDLGGGTGASLRALRPLVGEGLAWRLLDKDPALLAEARRRCGAGIEAVELDLAALDAPHLDGAGLVTASALLDLVSVGFLDRLADLLAARRLPFYAALSVDGRVAWDRAHPGDAAVVAAVAAHQRREKGLGAALGGEAARLCAEAFRARGYRVRLADSSWRLGGEDAALQAVFLDGFAAAARETGLVPEADLAGWLAVRQDAARGGSPGTVGHLDLLAVPGA